MLANWMFFWDEDPDWSGIAVDAETVPDPTPGRGSGKGGRDYEPLPDEFWEERERRLREHAPPDPTPDEPSDLPSRIRNKIQEALFEEVRAIIAEQSELTSLREHHANLLRNLRKAPGVAELSEMANNIATIEPELARLDKNLRSRIARAKSLRFQLLN